jgi:hypothetical protein
MAISWRHDIEQNGTQHEGLIRGINERHIMVIVLVPIYCSIEENQKRFYVVTDFSCKNKAIYLK